jgi:hypothetical protein
MLTVAVKTRVEHIDFRTVLGRTADINPLNAKLNPICHLLALLGAYHIFHVSGLRVKPEAATIVPKCVV